MGVASIRSSLHCCCGSDLAWLSSVPLCICIDSYPLLTFLGCLCLLDYSQKIISLMNFFVRMDDINGCISILMGVTRLLR